MSEAFEIAKMNHIARRGVPVVVNAWLGLALVISLAVSLAREVVHYKIGRAVQQPHVMVLTPDAHGNYDAQLFEAYEFKPDSPLGHSMIKASLIRFCKLFYSLDHYKVKDDFREALGYFMDGSFASTVAHEQELKDVADYHPNIVKFLMNPSADDVEVEANRVVLESLDKPPYRARLD